MMMTFFSLLKTEHSSGKMYNQALESINYRAVELLFVPAFTIHQLQSRHQIETDIR